MEKVMAGNVKLEKLNEITGFVGAALVDSDSGMALGMLGGGPINLEVAAAGNTEVVRAKRRVAASLGLSDNIEDILITLSKQYHLVRPLESNQDLFLYVVLDRARANLALARHELKSFEQTLDFK
jgi:predicted regulator of Ras-like GTPase activity (Roadblock/LC7/MglB family)